MLTAQELREIVHYDPETGVFTWKAPGPLARRVKPGETVGSRHRMGYLECSIGRRRFLLHRLAWLFVYGRMPNGVIDHINGQKQDNRICNLRDVDQVVNGLNRHGPNKNNKTGVLGVCKHSLCGKYMARANGRYLGLFDTVEQAAKAIAEQRGGGS